MVPGGAGEGRGHQGMRLCKWALCNLCLQELDHYAADAPVWWAFALCQHNLQSNAAWNTQGGCRCTRVYGSFTSKYSFLRSACEHALNQCLALRMRLPRYLWSDRKMHIEQMRHLWYFCECCSVSACGGGGGYTSEASVCLLSVKTRPAAPLHPSRSFFPRATRLSIQQTIPPESLRGFEKCHFPMISFSPPFLSPLSVALFSHSRPSLPLTVSSLLSLINPHPYSPTLFP